MNKKGFTFIELLVTISLIAVLSTSITVSMLKMYDNQKDSYSEEMISNIEAAACTYAEVESLRSTCTISCDVNINTLITEGYLDEDVYESYGLDKKVIISWSNTGLKTCVYEG